MAWEHPSLGKMEFGEICAYIRNKIELDNGCNNFSIYLGSDSQAHPKIKHTRYVTALILYTKGKGGTYFINKQDEPLVTALRPKIWREAIITLEYALVLNEQIYDLLLMDNVSLQIHADLGEHGPTKDLIKEVTGMFIAAGYDVKTKPYSFAASTAADKFSK